MQRLTYREQVERKINEMRKKRNFLAMLYYQENLDGLACAGWAEFKGSWAGEQWIEKHQAQADKLEKETPKF